VFEDRDVSLILGEGSEVGVVDGVEQALKKFKKGEKSLLIVKSHYAYGAEGCASHNIPANTDLEYEVELKKFEKVGITGIGFCRSFLCLNSSFV
jgi:FK506-binding protein 4/5